MMPSVNLGRAYGNVARKGEVVHEDFCEINIDKLIKSEDG